jgi:hypothetical protein
LRSGRVLGLAHRSRGGGWLCAILSGRTFRRGGCFCAGGAAGSAGVRGTGGTFLVDHGQLRADRHGLVLSNGDAAQDS